MKIICLLSGVLLLSLALASPSSAQKVTKYEKAPKKTVPQSASEIATEALEAAKREMNSRPPTEQELEARKRARQQYIESMQDYEYDPAKALTICEARAVHDKVLRQQNRIEELDAELVAREEAWKRDDERITAALKEEPSTDTRSDSERSAEWSSNPEAALARLRIATRKSPLLQELSLHIATNESACKLALASVQCFLMHCGTPLPPAAPTSQPNYSFPQEKPIPIYTGPSEEESRRRIEAEQEAERIRQLEQRQTDLEIQQKREKH